MTVDTNNTSWNPRSTTWSTTTHGMDWFFSMWFAMPWFGGYMLSMWYTDWTPAPTAAGTWTDITTASTTWTELS